MNTNDYSITYYAGEKRGTTVAVLTVNDTGQKFCGKAHCNPGDTYNREIGEKIAEARARKQFFKSEANEAYDSYQRALYLVAKAKKQVSIKANRYAREEKWLDNYLKTV